MNWAEKIQPRKNQYQRRRRSDCSNTNNNLTTITTPTIVSRRKAETLEDDSPNEDQKLKLKIIKR